MLLKEPLWPTRVNVYSSMGVNGLLLLTEHSPSGDVTISSNSVRGGGQWITQKGALNVKKGSMSRMMNEREKGLAHLEGVKHRE
jgi:hypothetical protein